MGLPNYLWNQMVNLIDKTDESSFNCTANDNRICYLESSCDQFTDFWSYSFKIQFAGQSNYLNVPLAAFASDNATSGYCDLVIENLGEQSEVVLGSMFLQQYIAYWQFDYTVPTAPVTTLSM